MTFLKPYFAARSSTSQELSATNLVHVLRETDSFVLPSKAELSR